MWRDRGPSGCLLSARRRCEGAGAGAPCGVCPGRRRRRRGGRGRSGEAAGGSPRGSGVPGSPSLEAGRRRRRRDCSHRTFKVGRALWCGGRGCEPPRESCAGAPGGRALLNAAIRCRERVGAAPGCWGCEAGGEHRRDRPAVTRLLRLSCDRRPFAPGP